MPQLKPSEEAESKLGAEANADHRKKVELKPEIGSKVGPTQELKPKPSTEAKATEESRRQGQVKARG